MTFYDMAQQGASQNPAQWGAANPQNVYGQRGAAPAFHGDVPAANAGLGLGQAAYGQPYGAPIGQIGLGAFGQGSFGQGPGGQMGQGGWGQTPWGGQPSWSMQAGQQRQLTPQDLAEVARQLAPYMTQFVAQAQQPLAAFGYGGLAPYGQQQRLLSQQEVNDVVRQILPILPQIVGALQGYASPIGASMFMQSPGHGAYGHAFFGQSPSGQQNPYGQNPYAQNPYGQGSFGQGFGGAQPFGQVGWPAVQAAFGAGPQQQRQLTPQDANDLARQMSWMTAQAGQANSGPQRMIYA